MQNVVMGVAFAICKCQTVILAIFSRFCRCNLAVSPGGKRKSQVYPFLTLMTTRVAFPPKFQLDRD